VSQATTASHTSIDALRARVGPMPMPTGLRAMFGILIAIGAAAFLVEVRSDPTRAYAAFLLGYFYMLGIALFGTLFTAVHHLVGATWSVVVRRVAESFTSYFPVAFLLFFVLLLGVPHLYVWSSTGVPAQAVDAEQLTKGGWLTPSAFAFRAIVALTIWSLFAWHFVRNSTRQDHTRDPRLSQSNVKAAAFFVPVFAITLTVISFDFLMSLEPLWFSTMFGVYAFAGLWQAGFAVLAIAVVLLRRQGALQGVVNKVHYHDLGKFLFAFSVFWMYIAFSQFMLIWYANLPEEIEWFIPRTYTGWGALGIALMIFKFAIPFFGLLHQRVKESESGLVTIAVCVLIGQWIDLYWVILPAFSPERVVLGWPELGVTLGFVGLFGWCVLGFLARHPVVAHGDPFFENSVRFHG
jgi:hypothetical protein